MMETASCSTGVHHNSILDMFVLFNRDKKFIGYSEDIPDTPNLGVLRLELPEVFNDLTKWQWEGDMLSGGMVEIHGK